LWVIAVDERERLRVGLRVTVFSLMMSAGGVIAVREGGALLNMLGAILILFGTVGIVQAGAIALGYLTPRGTGEGEKRDARHD
jgi:hypothetical protein